MARILILGGYGNLGKRIAQYLIQNGCTIILAGRHLQRAQDLQNQLEKSYPVCQIESIAINVHAADFKIQLEKVKADCVVHTAGPFQGHDYHIPQAAIELGIHYIDVADARHYVTQITSLDEMAKVSKVVVISGASTVPGLSSVIIAHFRQHFSKLREIQWGHSPGNLAEKGEANLASLLSYAGQPLRCLDTGKWITVYGWQNTHRHYYGDNLGLRWHGNADVPDLELMPQTYTDLETVRFYTGLEVGFMHFLLWKLSWFSRIGWVKNCLLFRRPVLALSRLFKKSGSDKGGIYLRLYGTSLHFQPLEIKWTLIAELGAGPYIPVIPVILTLKKILSGEIEPGARPCLNLFTLAEFDEMMKPWSLYYNIEERMM